MGLGYCISGLSWFYKVGFEKVGCCGLVFGWVGVICVMWLFHLCFAKFGVAAILSNRFVICVFVWVFGCCVGFLVSV